MKCLLLGITAVIGLFAFTESLTCNQCPASLIGICLNPSTTTCTTNTSVCSTASASFTGITGFLGFNYQSCVESFTCNTTGSGSILGVTYTISQTCCNTDKCNPATSSAPYVQLSLTAVLSTALLACIWGQSVY